MTSFDKAWGVAKTRGFDIRDHEDEDPLGNALDAARSKKRKPLPKNLGGLVRTGSDTGKCICGETWFNGDCKSDHCLWEAEE
tara:strand:- start:262 stop:507 length:246 start_codon:yes stop_codon:yes gene_type:complete